MFLNWEKGIPELGKGCSGIEKRVFLNWQKPGKGRSLYGQEFYYIMYFVRFFVFMVTRGILGVERLK